MALNDPVPSNAFDVLQKNMEVADEFANSPNFNATTRGAPNGKSTIRTIAGLEQDAKDAISNSITVYVGVWTTGVTTFNAYNEYAVFNGLSYKPKTTTTLPYVAQGADPTIAPDVDFVEPFSDVNSSSVIAGLNLINNPQFTTPSPDPITPPSATPTSYPSGTQIFSGWFADDSVGVTDLTYENGVINFTSGSIYYDVPNHGALLFNSSFSVSIAGTGLTPETTNVSFSLVGSSYRVVIASGASNVFSAKFAAEEIASKHEISDGSTIKFSDIYTMIDGAPIGSQCTSGGTRWIRKSLTGSISDFTPLTDVCINDFVLFGDGVNDDSVAINAAMALGFSSYLLNGDYLVNQTIVFSSAGQKLRGSGSELTILRGGPLLTSEVVRTNDFFQGYSNLRIDSDPGRTSGHGHVHAPKLDQSGQQAKNCSFESFRIINQPGAGMLLCTDFLGMTVKNFNISVCGEEGIYVNDGTAIGRVNNENVGGLNVHDGVIHDCGGHAVRGGDPTDPTIKNWVYRCRFQNIDTYRNATDPAKRLTDRAWYLYGDNNCIEQCAMGGEDVNTQPAIGSLFIAGRNNRIINNRYIKVGISSAIFVGLSAFYPTSGIVIDGFHTSGQAASLNPAVSYDSGVENLTVRIPQGDGIVTPVLDLYDSALTEIVFNERTFFSSLVGTGRVNFGQAKEIQISSGSISYDGAHIKTDTEGLSAADDLTTITNGSDGSFLFLRSSSGARVVTVKSGVGNIRLSGNSDRILNSSQDLLTLFYHSGQWFEQSFTTV